LPHAVDYIHQFDDVAFAKPPSKVPTGRRIRDTLRSEPVKKGLVVASQFNVLQAHTLEHRVVGQVQNMVTLMVGQMPLEQMQPGVDFIGQPQLLDHHMHRSDPTAIDPTVAIGHLVVDVSSFHHRLGLIAPGSPRIQPTLDSTLALAKDFWVSFLHSKCPLFWVGLTLIISIKPSCDGHFEFLLPGLLFRSRLFKD
jgi:hypothetical protein